MYINLKKKIEEFENTSTLVHKFCHTLIFTFSHWLGNVNMHKECENYMSFPGF